MEGNNFQKWVEKLSRNSDTVYSDLVFYATKHLKETKGLLNIHKSRKDNQISNKNREIGNKEYGKKKLSNALEYYNRAIAYADHNEPTECLALGYANRSAVLFELGYFNECESDINRALSLNYPDTKRQKLITRLELCKASTNRKTYVFHSTCPTITNPHPTIKCAENNIRIHYDPEMGRQIIATKNIEPGDTIIIEKPYTCNLKSTYWYRNCNYCLEQKLDLIPCKKCPYVLYCNEVCQKLAFEKYHLYECELYNQILQSEIKPIAQIALRITISARNEYPKILQTSRDCPEFIFKDELNYWGIHYLVTNIEHIPADELCQKALIGALLLHFLKLTSFFDDLDEGVVVASDLLLRHLLTAPSNFHSLGVAQPYSDSRSEGVQLANAAYPILSMVNHSCAPNVFRQSFGSTTVLRAVRPIKAGMQVFDNYGFHYAMHPRIERQLKLAENYYFECSCEACVKNWPLWKDSTNPTAVLPYLKLLEPIIANLVVRNVDFVKPFYPQLIQSLRELDVFAPCNALCEYQESFKEYYFLQGNCFHIYDY